jgi:hypothetical protein
VILLPVGVGSDRLRHDLFQQHVTAALTALTHCP